MGFLVKFITYLPTFYRIAKTIYQIVKSRGDVKGGLDEVHESLVGIAQGTSREKRVQSARRLQSALAE